MVDLVDLVQRTSVTFDEPTYQSLRNTLFSGLLGLGSFQLAGFAFISTRVHDFMKSPAAAAKRAVVQYLDAQVEFTLPLRRATERTLRAVVACFAGAFMQITVGLFGYSWSRWAAFLGALTAFAICLRALQKNLQMYRAWLKPYEDELKADAEASRSKSRLNAS